jgi:peptidoglycan biosynthesis protein MviN/MurJ (putative lipid II flippase)
MERSPGGLLDLSSIDDGSRITIALAFVAVAYLVITLDRRRDGSPSRDDTQVGIKLVLWAIIAMAVVQAAGGIHQLLAFILGGFKGWKADPLATMITGGGIAAVVFLLLLPRTNNLERPQVERYGVGLIGVLAALLATAWLDSFLGTLLAGAKWGTIATGLAGTGVYGGLAVLALFRLGGMSGWRAIPKAPPMPMQPPMTGQPMPPPGTGMPPLGGGYPPQGGGGYPPQGGGGWPTQ